MCNIIWYCVFEETDHNKKEFGTQTGTREEKRKGETWEREKN
jgi:hypothetical protein